ncbi:peptidylprolyl isomerase [Paenibacillus daejeonensis]|uniref:peptidylprolyl isomerase n=1 Tax=Paenibacillus daejeonensis TaxID=135193 RepID=UPI00037F92D0|nr:peptidylprolyl isomerase [Paenibacillus daejeonensis]
MKDDDYKKPGSAEDSDALDADRKTDQEIEAETTPESDPDHVNDTRSESDASQAAGEREPYPASAAGVEEPGHTTLGDRTDPEDAERAALVSPSSADPQAPVAPETPPISTTAPNTTASASGRGWMGVSLVLLIALIAVTIWGAMRGGAIGGDDVATVNGVGIPKETLYQELVKSGGEQTLDNLITEELIRQEFDKSGVVVTDEDQNKEIESLKASYPEGEFELVLAQNGLTEEALKEQLYFQIGLRKYFEPQTNVTEEQVKEYYESIKDQLGTPAQVTASHILLETREEAEAVKAELDGGADFAELAREKSQDPGSKEQGGELGSFGPGAFNNPAFEDAAFALEAGGVSDVVESPSGFHIIKVTDKQEGVTPPYEEQAEMLRNQLISQEANPLIGPWIEEVRANATIRNTLAPEEEPTEDVDPPLEGIEELPLEGNTPAEGNAPANTPAQ